MPVHVVMEQPHARHLVGLRRGIAALLGLVLILVSWATLPVLAYLLYRSYHHTHHSSSSVGTGTVVAFVALVIALLVVPRLVGLRLVRGSRRLVLFLRRFGYTDATDALTFAALTTMGSSWRLVTLDDAAVAPVGISRGMTKFAAAGEFSWVWFGRARKRIGLLTRLALGAGLVGMAVAAAHTYLRHHSELTMVEAGVGYHHRATHVGDAGTFRIFLIVAILAVAAAVVFAVVALILMPVFRPWHRFSATLQRAEQAKVTRVVSPQDVLKVAGAVRNQARKVFSPRLMVLNVDSAVWQTTVKTVANLASVVLIDVSVLTENLLWEIAEVVEDPSTACVLVGHAEGLRALDVIDTPLEQQLVELLDGRTILAYETSEQGMTRFANALRATLEVAVSRRR